MLVKQPSKKKGGLALLLHGTGQSSSWHAQSKNCAKSIVNKGKHLLTSSHSIRRVCKRENWRTKEKQSEMNFIWADDSV